MSPRRVILVDDERAAGLGPLASTRPTFAIRCGLYTPLERYLASPDFEVVGLRVRPELADVTRELAPDIPVNAAAVSADKEIDGRTIDLGPLGGGLHILERPWQVVDRNGDAVAADIQGGQFPRAELPTHVTSVGPAEDLFLDPAATVNPFVVFDTTGGPIYVGPDAVIDSFSKIEGPAAICEGARILSARIRGGTTVGPHCRVGGEIEASVFQGYSNKYHDGFLGHAFVGEWVNIGAATNNSDLRNDYGDVHVPMAAGDRVEKIATGSKKAGVYLGDHVKTAIGSLFN
ncbi:MAG: putative sugar nucleotidyl transferase, partial [Planctomycetota bacterium]